MVKKNKLDVAIKGCPIFREEDGLAMSSRNSRLCTESREIAPFIYKKFKEGDDNRGSFVEVFWDEIDLEIPETFFTNDGKEYNKKKYVEIRENGEWVNFQMLEIEKYPCLDNNEARSRKEVLRKELKANMNTIRAFRTDEEKKQDRIEY
jgi:pantothenate synthetase